MERRTLGRTGLNVSVLALAAEPWAGLWSAEIRLIRSGQSHGRSRRVREQPR
jgi:hypothetical protein